MAEDGIGSILARLLPRGVTVSGGITELKSFPSLHDAEQEEVGTVSRDRLAHVAWGRWHARRAMRSLCGFTATIHRTPTGAPRWPAGLVGSISHSPALCVAVCGYESSYLGLGIDTEVASDVPSSLLSYVASPSELLAGEPAHRLFSVKEAIFKAINPIGGDWLEFSDVTVGFDGDEWRAEVRGYCVTGRCLYYRGSVLSAAWIDAAER